jgi:ankyrin repeat protein
MTTLNDNITKQNYTYGEIINALDTPEILENILKSGFDIYKYGSLSKVTLFVTALDKPEALKVMLRYEPDVNNLKDLMDRSLLCSALGKPEAFKILLEHGINPNLYDGHEPIILRAARQEDRINLVKLLLEHGANPDEKDSLGKTLLESHYPDTKMFELLLQHGANPNIEDRFGHKFITMFSHKPELVIKLLEHGANPNVEMDYKPFIFGVLGYPKVVKALLEHNVDPNTIDQLNDNILNKAIKDCFLNGYTESAIHIIKAGGNIKPEELTKRDIERFYQEAVKHLATKTYDDSNLKDLRRDLQFYDSIKSKLNTNDLVKLEKFIDIIDSKKSLDHHINSICNDLNKHNEEEHKDEQGNIIPELPNEIIYHIFSFLNIDEVDLPVTQEMLNQNSNINSFVNCAGKSNSFSKYSDA